MSANVEITCPKCQQRMQIKRPEAPVQVKCPKCQQVMRLGGQRAAANPSREPAPAARPRAAADPLASTPDQTPKPAAAPQQFRGASHPPHKPVRPKKKSGTSSSGVKTGLIVAGLAASTLFLGAAGFVAWKLFGSQSVTEAEVEGVSESDPMASRNPMPRNQTGSQIQTGSPDSMASRSAVRQKIDARREKLGMSTDRRSTREKVESMQAEIDAEVNAQIAKADALSASPMAVKVTDADRSRASAAASTAPHKEILSEFVENADDLLTTLRGIRNASAVDAGTVKLREITREFDTIMRHATAVDPLSKSQLTEVIGSIQTDLLKNSTELEKEYVRVRGANHFGNADFKRAIERAGIELKGTLGSFQSYWSELRPPLGGIGTEKAEHSVLLVQQDLWRKVNAVESKEDFQRLPAAFEAATKQINAIIEQEHFWLTSTPAFKSGSTYARLYGIYTGGVESRMRQNSRLYGVFTGKKEMETHSKLCKRLLRLKEAERKDKEKKQKSMGTVDRFSSEGKIARYLDVHEGKPVVIIRIDGHIGPKVLTVIRSFHNVGSSVEVPRGDDETLALLIHDGPLSDIVEIVRGWGNIKTVDEENRTIWAAMKD